MGGGPMSALGISLDSVALQQSASNVQQSLASAQLANQQAALNQHQRATDPMSYERAMQASVLNQGVRGVDTRSVPSTAASRVQKADWEMEYDRKDREVDEMIERQRQERERVRIEEVSHVVEAEKHSESVSGSFGHDGGNED